MAALQGWTPERLHQTTAPALLCARVIVLGLDQPIKELTPKLALEKDSGNGVGFAIGRSIWRQPAEKWFAKEISDPEAVAII